MKRVRTPGTLLCLQTAQRVGVRVTMIANDDWVSYRVGRAKLRAANTFPLKTCSSVQNFTGFVGIRRSLHLRIFRRLFISRDSTVSFAFKVQIALLLCGMSMSKLLFHTQAVSKSWTAEEHKPA